MPETLHAAAKVGVVGASAAQVVEHRHDARRLFRSMCVQPLAEQSGDLVRQAQQRVARARRPMVAGYRKQHLEFPVVEAGYQRRDECRDGDAGVSQSPHGLQPRMRRAGPRFELTRECAIERGQGNADVRQLPLREFGPEVDVTNDQRRLGDHRYRMAGFQKDFEQAPRQLFLALERLVGVGGGTERDDGTDIVRVAELLAQQARGIRLHEDLRFEIESGREAQESVCRACIAIDATVFAAAIGVQRLVETDVGRIVAADDRLRAVDQQACPRV